MKHYPLDYAQQEMSETREEQGGTADEGGKGDPFSHVLHPPEEFGTQKDKVRSLSRQGGGNGGDGGY